MDYMDIEELLEDLIQKYPDVEVAEEQWNALLNADEELKSNYSEWCIAKGYNEKRAFTLFYQDYVSREDNIWDSIFPNQEEYDGYK